MAADAVLATLQLGSLILALTGLNFLGARRPSADPEWLRGVLSASLEG